MLDLKRNIGLVTSLLFGIMGLFILSSCNDDDDDVMDTASILTIEEFIADQNLQTEDGGNGLQYIIDSVGYLDTMGRVIRVSDSFDNSCIEQGGCIVDYPELSDIITVRYRGYWVERREGEIVGAVFDQALQSEGIELSLANTIEGWQLGIPQITKGGYARLYIPSELAYGSTGSGRIPPNTDIIFEVHLVDF